MHDTVLRLTLRDEHFKRAPDFSRVIKRLQKNVGKLEDCVRLYYFFVKLPSLFQLFSEYAGPHDNLIKARYTDTLQVKKFYFKFYFLLFINIHSI